MKLAIVNKTIGDIDTANLFNNMSGIQKNLLDVIDLLKKKQIDTETAGTINDLTKNYIEAEKVKISAVNMVVNIRKGAKKKTIKHDNTTDTNA